jgi:hypothetical protein
VMSVTLIFLEKINGMSSTPTFSDFAVTNGNFPNAGSSAMAILSAPTLPDRIDKLRSPTVTCLPKAALASDCTVGRNVFTLINSGKAIRIRRRTATAIPPIRSQRFIIQYLLLFTGQNRYVSGPNLAGEDRW